MSESAIVTMARRDRDYQIANFFRVLTSLVEKAEKLLDIVIKEEEQKVD